MKYITRFNPTIYTESLHCGHLYMALVNEREAHRSGGQFIVRIDDTQKYWRHKLGIELLDQCHDEYYAQLHRFLVIDKWERQSNMPSIETIMDISPLENIVPKPRWFHDLIADWVSDPDMAMYPYAPAFTFEKVIWDFYEGVNWLIRGEDLATEVALYDFFADVLGLPRMRQTLLPRLRAKNRGELGRTAVSKTLRNYNLSKQIDKFGTEGVLEYLKQSCLIDPEKEFYVENIKWNPTVIGFEP